MRAREKRLQRLGDRAIKRLGIETMKLAPHDPEFDETPEVLFREGVAVSRMEIFDGLWESRRKALANLEVATKTEKKGEV